MNSYTIDKMVFWGNCPSCGEQRTTIGCVCDKEIAVERTLELLYDPRVERILDPNGFFRNRTLRPHYCG